MKPILVVITVPHAYCGEVGRNCDEIAKEMGLKLQKRLKIETRVFLATTPRYQCDFNRPYCTPTKNQKFTRNTPYRKSITSFIKKKKKNRRIFLLDVHSYSNSKDHKRESTLRGWDFYILVNKKTLYISNHFIEYMKTKGLNGNSFIADHRNDIIEEFAYLENFLIEFNEDLLSHNSDRVLDGVASWINSYFVNPTGIVSPVSGVIDHVGKNKIGIYIRISDNHNIYSPINGVPKFETFQGRIMDHNFRSFPNKRGKLIVFIGGIKFEVLVGKGFVTDNIKILNSYKKNKFLERGERFAEIILGSYAYIYIKPNKNYIQKGLELDGGLSCIGNNNNNNNQINSSSLVKDLKVKVVKYPSTEFDKIREELSSLEKVCQPRSYEYPYEPLVEGSELLLGYFLGKIAVFLSYTKTELAWSYIASKGALRKDKRGYFITDVCSDIARYRGLGTALLQYYVKNVAKRVDYSLLWVAPENKGAIGLYERYGDFKLIDHIDGLNIMLRREEKFLLGIPKIKVVKELKLSSQNFRRDNLDSLDVFEDLLIVTAKSTHRLLVFDKHSLELRRIIKGDLKRPNGIKILKNFCFIVERDGHRVSVFRLPKFKFLYRFGADTLKKPYGIDGVESAIRIFDVYITDTGGVYVYRVNTITDSIELISNFGEGVLKQAESILLLPNKKILVANEGHKRIAVFVKESYIGDMTREYKYDPEGLAKYDNFIISVDQGPTPQTNRFLVYEGLEYKGYFITESTKNTDGICVDGNFLYAVDDDRRVSKIKLF